VKNMLVKVILGSIKHNDSIYGVGQTVEIEDKHALAIIREGVAEEVLPEVEEKKAKKAKVEKVEKPKEEKSKEVEAKAEPSIDWTRKELIAHAMALGIEEPDKLGAKEKILEAIQAEEVKTK